jgi:YYY domain-containing protein
MLTFLVWYLLVTLIGWLTFPLAFRLFPALADRGFSLARALGMLVWGYAFWMMASLGVIQNDISGLLLALVVLTVITGSGIWRREARKTLGEWIKSNRRVIITVEILFFLAFAFLVFVRACNPEIVGTEKPMELAFINAILRSPTFPPHDPWLSGYAISYYYFGYVMTAMLAKLTGTLGSVAFNLMLSLIFALSAVGAYGVLYSLLAAWQKKHLSPITLKPMTGWPLLGPFFLLIVSNFEGFLEILHSKGLFWKFAPDGSATSSFWNWLGILDLNQAPAQPFTWTPQRYYWWWRASRVIQDLSLAGKTTGQSEIIDEFPFFSYLLGDLHPHVLAMPFGLLAVAMAINLFAGGWKGETNLGFYRLSIRPMGLCFGALILGGLAFLNTWDILTGFTLFLGAYALARALESGWKWKRLEDIIALGMPVGILAILLYLPFYVGFSSQAGGLLPNLVNPTRGVQLWVMFGPLFLPIIAYLILLWRSEKRSVNWKLGLGLAGIIALLLWIFSWLLGLLANFAVPDTATSFLADQGFVSGILFFFAALLRRFSYIGSLLTLLGLLGAALAFLIMVGRRDTVDEDNETKGDNPYILRPTIFVLLLVLLGTVLVLTPDFVYLRDQFGWRLNTIFKFYYQAWLLFSIAASFGVAVLLQKLRGRWNMSYRVGLAVVLFMALIYPVLGLSTKTVNFQVPAFVQNLEAARTSGDKTPWLTAAKVWTLDGGEFYQNMYPDDMAAAVWLRSQPDGNIVEATRQDASYHGEICLISTYSGLPTVLGWPGHESQWRGTYDGLQQRLDDIKHLYETANWDEAKQILSLYDIRYVYVGTQERSIYHVNELKFQTYLKPVFQQGQVVIYQVP